MFCRCSQTGLEWSVEWGGSWGAISSNLTQMMARLAQQIDHRTYAELDLLLQARACVSENLEPSSP